MANEQERYSGQRVFRNTNGGYIYNIWYAVGTGTFSVVVESTSGVRNHIGSVGSYVEGEQLFLNWLLSNTPLQPEDNNA